MRVKIGNLAQTIFEMVKTFLQALTHVRDNLSERFAAECRRYVIQYGSHEQNRRKAIAVGV